MVHFSAGRVETGPRHTTAILAYLAGLSAVRVRNLPARCAGQAGSKRRGARPGPAPRRESARGGRLRPRPGGPPPRPARTPPPRLGRASPPEDGRGPLLTP